MIRTSLTLKPGGAGETLRQAAAEDWDASVDHRFVRELFQGAVADQHMGRYLQQDYTFFTDFIAMLGACVAHADSPAAQVTFAKQLGVLATDENTYFERAHERLNVPNIQQQPEAWMPATNTFHGVMRRAVQSQDYARLLVVLLVAEWLYMDWAERQDLGEEPSDWLYLEWIELHRGDAYRAWSQFLLDELENVWENHPEKRDELTALFQQCVAAERAFFDDTYDI